MSIGVVAGCCVRRASLCIALAGGTLFTFRRHGDVCALQFGFELPNASTVQLHQESDCVFATGLQVESLQRSQWQSR